MSENRKTKTAASGNIDRYFGIPLYFKCNGLFADPFVGDHLPTDGSPCKTGNKFIDNYWGYDEGEYNQFFEEINNVFERFYPTCQNWNEYQLEDKFIKPILSALGYEYDVQETVVHAGKRSRPDYTLFVNQKDLDQALKSKDRDESKYWVKAISVADAKAWQIDLDSDGGPQNCPSSQIVRYLDATVKDWGIITNGRQWRLYYRNCQDRSQKYFEVDLERICQSKNKFERLQYFFYFFRNKSLIKDNSNKCFLDYVLSESEAYSVQVSGNLKEKIIRQAPLITQAILNSKESDVTLDEAYKYSLYYCFRLIFVLAAESRSVLDIALDSKYHELSLRKMAFDLREKWTDGIDWIEDSCDTYKKLKKLFSLLESGDSNIGLIGFKPNAYENCDKKIFNKIELPDHVVNELVLDLACDIDKFGKKLFVDYKRISAEHLGGIFESLLEFKPHQNNSKKVLLEGATNRKDSGSYYTPDYVVDYLLERSLPHEITNHDFKVIDPACGSGHFVVGSIRALSGKLAENYKQQDSSISDLRREVAEKMVFGIDRNEMAVALTKLSIYLTTMQKDKSLPNIEDNIINRDSLRDKLPNTFKNEFNLVIGNPPYVNTKLLSKSDPVLKTYLAESDEYETCTGCFDLYIPFIERAIKSLIKREGVVSFVLPNKLMVADYAEGARLFSEKKCKDIEVIDISHLDVFKGVGVYPHMYILKTKQDDSPSVNFRLEDAEATVMDESFAWFKTKVINEEKKVPSGKIWSAQKKSRKGLVAMSSVCTIEGGVTGYSAQQILTALTESTKKNGKSKVPFIVSGNIGKGRLEFGNVRYMKHDFSNPVLDLSSDVITKGKKKLFENPKVIIAGMTKEIRTVYIKEPLAVGVGVFSVTSSNLPLEAVAAILNSLAFSYLYREKFEAKHLAGGYLAINASQLEEADFPSEISENDIKSLVKWSGKMSSKSYSTDDRLNFELFAAQLFGLSPKEISKLEIFDNESKAVLEKLRIAKAA